jgi:hypothetical protein
MTDKTANLILTNAMKTKKEITPPPSMDENTIMEEPAMAPVVVEHLPPVSEGKWKKFAISKSEKPEKMSRQF